MKGVKNKQSTTTFCWSLLREPLFPSCSHVANRCNMPATKQQEGSHQSIRKQPENPYFMFPFFFKNLDEPMQFDFISWVALRKMCVALRILLLKRHPATIWKQFNKKNGR